MKKFKHSLCILHLLLFLGSFTLLSYSGFSNNDTGRFSNQHGQVISPKHNSITNNLLQLSEENETENDDDFEIQALELAYILPQLQKQLIHSYYSCNQSLVEQASDPIYIRVCNLRV